MCGDWVSSLNRWPAMSPRKQILLTLKGVTFLADRRASAKDRRLEKVSYATIAGKSAFRLGIYCRDFTG